MTRVQIFDSARCAAARSGQVRLEAMGEVARAREQGAELDYFEMASDADEFARDPLAKEFLSSEGADALPLVIVDGKKALSGRYPTRAELARWLGLSVVKVNVDSVNCCSGGNCG